MITTDLFEYYVIAIAEYDASLGLFGRISTWLNWRLFDKEWCPRCQRTRKWTAEKGKGYDKLMCDCGLTFVIVEGRLYDIDIQER